jgi:trehalose synthase
VSGVADDPEGQAVLEQCIEEWRRLPAKARERVHVVSVPMDDVEENAAIVNALQRHASVVMQKSLAEGFGLTVSEAMWKQRPVVASAVGGIQDQIVDGEHGVLLRDPTDLRAAGSAVEGLLRSPEEAARLGRNARERVTREFLGDRHLIQWVELIGRLI